MQTLSGIAVLSSIAIGEMLVVDSGGIRIPQWSLSRDAVNDDLARFKGPIHEVTANIQRDRGSVSRQLSKQVRALLDVVALMPLGQRHYFAIRTEENRSRVNTLLVKRV